MKSQARKRKKQILLGVLFPTEEHFLPKSRKGEKVMNKLKTLKDIKPIFDTRNLNSDAFINPANQILAGKLWIPVEKLREEAIKWIKELRKNRKITFCLIHQRDYNICQSKQKKEVEKLKMKGMEHSKAWEEVMKKWDCDYLVNAPYEQDDYTPIITWIKHFFNIKEEDLK